MVVNKLPDGATSTYGTGTNKRRELLFCTYVYDWYEHYIPTYIYSILRSYPEYHVRILYREALSSNVRRALEIVAEISDNFEVTENFMQELEGNCRGIRWLLKRSCFEPFENAWIGDVDSLHIRESTAMLESESLLADEIGLPYVNQPWGVNEPHRWLLRGGMHFIKVAPYFDHVTDIIEQWLADKHAFPPDRFLRSAHSRNEHHRASDVPDYRSDEYLLYCLMERAFGVLTGDDPRLSKRYMYGIHLGEARLGRNQRDTVYRHSHMPESILAMISEPRFRKIRNLLDSRVQRDIDRTERELRQGRSLARLARAGFFPDTKPMIANDARLEVGVNGGGRIIIRNTRALDINDSALAVARLCDGQHTLMQIVDALCDACPNQAPEIPADVDGLVAYFLAKEICFAS